MNQDRNFRENEAVSVFSVSSIDLAAEQIARQCIEITLAVVPSRAIPSSPLPRLYCQWTLYSAIVY